MSLCVLTAAKTVILATSAFSLSWTHSVEKITWQEDWQLQGQGLQLVMARVQGSGAGMEPGEGAKLLNGWWQWQPLLPNQAELVLAASGTTASGWRLCPFGLACLDLGATASEPVKLWVCD